MALLVHWQPPDYDSESTCQIYEIVHMQFFSQRTPQLDVYTYPNSLVVC